MTNLLAPQSTFSQRRFKFRSLEKYSPWILFTFIYIASYVLSSDLLTTYCIEICHGLHREAQ